MYLRYVEPPDLTEDELKEQIVHTILDLLEKWPEKFELEPTSIPSPEIETISFVSIFADLPGMNEVRASILASDPMRALRVILRFLSAVRWSFEIETRMIALISLMNSPQFLGVRYELAANVILDVLKEQLKYDYEEISEFLLNPHDRNPNQSPAAYEAAAEEEIARVMANPQTREKFLDATRRFDDRVENQIKKALPAVILEMAYRLTTEALMVSVSIIDEEIGDSDEPERKFFRDVLDQFVRKGIRFTNERVGIRRGGSRTTSKFVWNDDRKREFYEAVTRLVHKDGTPLWTYAHKELVDKDFSYRIVGFLRSETQLKDVPRSIWEDAVKTWQAHANSFGRLPPDKTPAAFGMRHALVLLGFPLPAFSTLKKYYGEGKRLSNANKDV